MHVVTPHGQAASPWNQNQASGGSVNRVGGNSYNLNDHLNTVREINTNNGVVSPNAVQKSMQFSPNTIQGQNAAGVPLNSTRVPATNKNKLIDSKMSSLRHEQDSTAASNNNHRFPMSADDAFKILSPYLWEVEKREIFEYKTIYFFPIEERKKQKLNGANVSSPGSQSEMGVFNDTTNNGFDSECNEYISRINEHLAYRYELTKKLGKGSFGVVLKCYDHKEREYVALKILKNKKRLYKQGLVEAKLSSISTTKILKTRKTSLEGGISLCSESI